MRIDILTLFPEMLRGPFDASIVARAREAGLLELAVHNPRDWARDRHQVVDDYAYGGGPGMVMKPEPLFECVDAVRAMAEPPGKVVLLTPQGRLLDQRVIAELAGQERLILLCGHYEGVDERVHEALADDEISIGDYVLSGGEPAAVVLVDAIARHIPNVLGSEHSLTEESHAQGLLEYPQYTRPPEYRGLAVPNVLLSGHHGEVERWRRRESILRTARRRPDMLATAELTPEERRWLDDELAATPGATRAQLFRVAVPVPNMKHGVAFYAALLGQPGTRIAPARHEFRCGGTVLALVDPSDHGIEFQPNVEHVYFAVPDLRERFYAARKVGCSSLDERIAVQPSGEKSFCARDPFGNPICFVDERTVFTGKEPIP